MKQAEIRKVLEKQLQLLSERSQESSVELGDLVSMSHAMVNIVEILSTVATTDGV